MERRTVLLRAGAVLAGAVAVAAGTDSPSAVAYEVTLGIEPGKEADEFRCRVFFRSPESAQIHETEGSFKPDTTGTLRTGEGRPDGSAIEVMVEVSIDASGERAHFISKITDRDKVVGVRRRSVALPRS